MTDEIPLIRTIHHLSCSGGTVISKCIASMPDTVVLSEVHPDRLRKVFNPFDPVQLLLSQPGFRQDKALRHDVFLDRIKQADTIARQAGKKVVLRDHTHSDYLEQRSVDEISSKTSLHSLLAGHFETRSVLTLRNPLHSFASLRRNKWGGAIASFDDYCQRVLLMLDTYENLDSLVVRYEDFCQNPDSVLRQICDRLELEFFPGFTETFHNHSLTGDSGRARDRKQISSLKPRKIVDRLKKKAQASSSFKTIIERYGYSLD